MQVGEAGAPSAGRAVGGRPSPSPEMVRRLRRLGESVVRSPRGLGMADAEGRIEWVNAAFVHHTGWAPDELIGKHPLEALSRLVAPGEIESMRTELAEGREAVAEFQTRTREGHPYWSQFRMSRGPDDGGDPYYVFFEQDITERQRIAVEADQVAHRAEAIAEELRGERELLASVLSTIPHVVFWKDTTHSYLGCNDAYARLRGVASQDELIGRREADLDADQIGSLIAEIEGDVLDTGVPVIDRSLVLPGSDNDQRAMVFSVLPRYTEGPTPGGVIGVGMDVTRITALERQLAQATRLESIGQLAAGLAHEINTPVQYVSDNALFLADSFTDVLEALRSIANVARGAEQDPRAVAKQATVADLRARLQLLVDGLDLDFLGTEIPSALEQTLEGIARVAEIVRAMKEFSHPGQGRVETDLNHAVETTVQVSRSEWKYIAEMELELDPEVGLVPCYEGELKQVVLNLVVNAAHAIAEAHEKRGETALGRIGIKTRRDQEEDMIRLSITDNGTGMTEETRVRIFDPFFTTKAVGKGTGQGLAMAHNCVVGKHGGSIDVFSEVGVGTTFQLNLPATVEADAVEEEDFMAGEAL